MTRKPPGAVAAMAAAPMLLEACGGAAARYEYGEPTRLEEVEDAPPEDAQGAGGETAGTETETETETSEDAASDDVPAAD